MMIVCEVYLGWRIGSTVFPFLGVLRLTAKSAVAGGVGGNSDGGVGRTANAARKHMNIQIACCEDVYVVKPGWRFRHGAAEFVQTPGSLIE